VKASSSRCRSAGASVSLMATILAIACRTT
jgi:hypothetical protein